MAATSTAADAGFVSDAVKALNASVGARIKSPALPTSPQAVVLNPDGSTTTQAIPDLSPVAVSPGLVDITAGVASVTPVSPGLVQIGA